MDNYRAPRFGFNTHGNVIPIPHPGGRNVTLIAALDAKGGIGKNGGVPWAVSQDMQHFKRLTEGHPIVMGRRTFESLKSKPLPKRTNVVVTRQLFQLIHLMNDYDNLVISSNLENAIDCLSHDQIFIIGGTQIYQEALELDIVCDMILTRFNHDAQCDTFFPKFDEQDWLTPSYSTHDLGGRVEMRFEYWRRKFRTAPLNKESHGNPSSNENEITTS